jgi:hypothetical protein
MLDRIPNVASMLACGSPVRASSPNLKRYHLPRVEWMESGKRSRDSVITSRTQGSCGKSGGWQKK